VSGGVLVGVVFVDEAACHVEQSAQAGGGSRRAGGRQGRGRRPLIGVGVVAFDHIGTAVPFGDAADDVDVPVRRRHVMGEPSGAELSRPLDLKSS
jgi:hypothetical protein